MSGVDVLEMLDAYHAVPCTWGRNHDRDEIMEVRAAVADLTKCCDATVKAFESLGRANGVIAQHEAHRACERALIEQKAALARIGGDQ